MIGYIYIATIIAGICWGNCAVRIMRVILSRIKVILHGGPRDYGLFYYTELFVFYGSGSAVTAVNALFDY